LTPQLDPGQPRLDELSETSAATARLLPSVTEYSSEKLPELETTLL